MTGPKPPPGAAASLSDLVEIMRRLRDPNGGCPWDLVQDFATIAPYTIEEAYEVADAIARNDLDELKDELGDLQLQVVYHARMAEELGAFTIDDVMASICAKMIRRHPHVFGDAQSPGWEALKAAERERHEDKSALAGVALALPALKRAEKIDEELAELEAAASDAERTAELGDLLFSVVNLARHLGIDPEAALRGTIERFEARFRHVETIADAPLAGMDIEQLEALWQRAKQEVQAPSV